MNRLKDFINGIPPERWRKIEIGARIIAMLEYFLAAECYVFYSKCQIRGVYMLAFGMLLLSLALLTSALFRFPNCIPEASAEDRGQIRATITFFVAIFGYAIIAPLVGLHSGPTLVLLGMISLACGICVEVFLIPHLRQRWQ